MRTFRRYIAAATAISMMLLTFSSCAEKENSSDTSTSAAATTTAPAASSSEEAAEASVEVSEKEALFLGVKDYGSEEVNMDNKENFKYRFEIDGKEQILSINNGTKDTDGNFDYPIQNILKENYRYNITVEGDVVTAAEEIKTDETPYTPCVSGTPGEKTLTNFLKTSLMPAGTTLYIFGGGWDWQDIGSSVSARSLGVSPDWVKFFNDQDKDFTYRDKDGDEKNEDPANSYYPYGGYNEYYYAGLDCSGFVGWIEYNTFETKNEEPGYVMYAEAMAKDLADRGFGQWTQDIKAPDGKNGYVMLPGDIMSTDGHVWVSLGTCDDGSIVIVHSTPSDSRSGQPGGGVQISAIGNDESCEAYQLADKYMSKYFPDWYERYPAKLCAPEDYFGFEGEDPGRFTWDIEGNTNGFTDPDELQKKTPEEVLKALFGE